MMPWLPRRHAVDEARWVVLDVESSGLDAARDRLLALAAVAVAVDRAQGRLEVRPGDSFEVVLQQDRASSHDNILVHGIGVARQSRGEPMGPALRAFADYAGSSPLLAFHAAFDRTLVERHVRLAGVPRLRNPWLDIEPLCAVSHPGVRARSLDDWLDHFHIACAVRHQAAADAFATAALLQRIWPPVAAEARAWRDVERLAARRRWLPAA